MKNTRGDPKAGFTLVEIMIVVAIIGLLAAIAIPNFIKARATTQTNACINNLRQVDAAKQEWALENKKVNTDVPLPVDLEVYMGHSTGGAVINVSGGTVTGEINCPADGTYTIANMATSPTCDVANHALN